MINGLADALQTTSEWLTRREQQRLNADIPKMQSYLEAKTDKTESLQKFIDKARKITELKELTPELIHKFIDRTIVYAPRYLNGKCVQLMDIYYNGVGTLRERSKAKTA